MKSFICSLWLSFFFTSAISQEVVEQLREELRQATTDTTRARLLSQLSEAYVGIDSANVFKYGYGALTMWQDSKNDFETGRTYFKLGNAFYNYYDPRRAHKNYTRAAEEFDRLLQADSAKLYQRYWLKSRFNSAVMLGELGNTYAQIKQFTQIAPVAEKLREYDILAVLNSNLAFRFNNLHQYEKAYQLLAKSESIYKKTSSEVQAAFLQDRIVFSACLHMLDSIPQMKIVLDQIRDTLSQLPHSLEWPMFHIVNGKYFARMEDYASAQSQLDSAYGLLVEGKRPFYLKEVFRDYVELYFTLEDLEKAKYYIERFHESIQDKHDPLDKLQAIEFQATYYDKTKKYRNATDYLWEYKSLQDSLNVVAINEHHDRLLVEHETYRKEREILALERQNLRAGMALEKAQFQRYINLLVFGFMLVLLVAGGYVFFRRKQHEVETREQQRTMLMKELRHQQQTQVLSALIEGQEKERQRLASDLHDGLAGRLSGITFHLAQFTRQANRKPEVHDIRDILTHMNSSLTELRCITRNLTPKMLSEAGLEVALKDYCGSLSGASNNIVLQFYETGKALEESTSLILYRVIQELIHNAVKYAQASEILVQYVRENHAINITVEDDGVGFDVQNRPSSSRMGLNNVRTRVNYLNGKIEIQSSPGQGTTVWIQVSV